MDMTHAFALPDADVAADPIWQKLVADFVAERDKWLATSDILEEARADFDESCALLPHKPNEPSSGLSANMIDMTIREIKAAGETPENKAAWDDYERAHAAWKADRDALAERTISPAKAVYDQAYSISSDAFNALATYRITSLRDLHEKIEIIAKDYEGFDISQEYFADVLADIAALLARTSAPIIA